MAFDPDDEIAAAFGDVARSIITPADAKRALEFAQMSAGGGKFKASQAAGLLPRGATNVVESQSILVDANPISNARNLKDMLAAIVAAIGPGGSAFAGTDYLYFTEDEDATSPHWIVYGGKLVRRSV